MERDCGVKSNALSGLLIVVVGCVPRGVAPGCRIVAPLARKPAGSNGRASGWAREPLGRKAPGSYHQKVKGTPNPRPSTPSQGQGLQSQMCALLRAGVRMESLERIAECPRDRLGEG